MIDYIKYRIPPDLEYQIPSGTTGWRNKIKIPNPPVRRGGRYWVEIATMEIMTDHVQLFRLSQWIDRIISFDSSRG
jgi:hypothetical protein